MVVKCYNELCRGVRRMQKEQFRWGGGEDEKAGCECEYHEFYDETFKD